MFPRSAKSCVKWFWKLCFLPVLVAVILILSSQGTLSRTLITASPLSHDARSQSPPSLSLSAWYFLTLLMMTRRFDFGGLAGSRPTMEWKIDVFVMNYVVTWRFWVDTHGVHKLVVWVPDVPEQSCVVCYISWVQILAHNPAVVKVL